MLSCMIRYMLYPFVSESQLKRYFGSGTDPLTILILLLFLYVFSSWCWTTLFKSLRLCRFKSDWHDIWQDCSSCWYALIDGVGYSIWRHTCKMAAMTSFQVEKCCHLLSTHAYAACICSSVRRLNSLYSSWSIVHSFLLRVNFSSVICLPCFSLCHCHLSLNRSHIFVLVVNLLWLLLLLSRLMGIWSIVSCLSVRQPTCLSGLDF